MLVEAEELEGFFVSPGGDAPEVVFRRANLSDERPRQVEDAVLGIVNARRDKIGEYLVGRVIFGDVDPKRVPFRFFGDRCEFPEAVAIWRRWASEPPLRAGEWLRLPVRHHPAWLHVVQNSWFATGHGSGGGADAEVMTLNGASVVTKAGFYCALGEAARGPGGSFGSNLDALVDCLRSGPAGKRPARLLWNDFFSSEEALGTEFLDAVTGVLEEFGVIVEAR